MIKTPIQAMFTTKVMQDLCVFTMPNESINKTACRGVF